MFWNMQNTHGITRAQHFKMNLNLSFALISAFLEMDKGFIKRVI